MRIINALNAKVIYDDNVGLYDAATVDPKLFAFYDVNHDSNLPRPGSVKVVGNSIDHSRSQMLGSVDVATATDAAFAEDAESIDRVLEMVDGW